MYDSRVKNKNDNLKLYTGSKSTWILLDREREEEGEKWKRQTQGR